MKMILFGVTLMITTQVFAVSNEVANEFLESTKKMIVETTEIRIVAGSQGQFSRVCNALGNDAGTDTEAYSMAFTLFEDGKWGPRLKALIDPILARNFETMFRRNLPFNLHEACVRSDRRVLQNILIEMDEIRRLR